MPSVNNTMPDIAQTANRDQQHDGDGDRRKHRSLLERAHDRVGRGNGRDGGAAGIRRDALHGFHEATQPCGVFFLDRGRHLDAHVPLGLTQSRLIDSGSVCKLTGFRIQRIA